MTPPLPANDADLVVLARRGRDDAFAVLYERYFNGVFDFLTRLLRDRHEAADVAQDTFVKAFERLGHLRNPSAFKSWIFTIAHRNALNRIKRSKRAIAVGSFADVDADERAAFAVVDEDRAGSPELQVEVREAAALVWEAAAGLDDRTYAVMDLHVRQGLDSAEIAEVLGVSKGNAYTMVSRMKKSVSATMSTYLLVRKGRANCAELAEVVDAHGGPELTPELRRAVDRHARVCATCTEARRTLFVPLKLFAALAAVPAPAALKGAIWAAVSGTAAGAAGVAAGGAAVGGGQSAATSAAGGASATTTGGTALGASTSTAAAAATAAVTAAGSGTGVGKLAVAIAAVLTAALATLGGIGLMTRDGDAPQNAAAATGTAVPSTVQAEPRGTAAPPGTPAPPGETETTEAPPVAFAAVDDEFDVVEDTPAAVDVLANDEGVDAGTLAVAKGPAHGEATVENGAIRYTPAPDYFGSDTLVYEVAGVDGSTGEAVVAISVIGVNDAPRSDGERTVRIDEDGVARIDPLAGITDPDGDPLTVSAFDTETANGGRVTGGSLVYRPAADWFGTDRFSYRVSDGTASLDVRVTVSVAPVDDPPRWPGRTVTLREDGSVTVDLLDGWFDVEGRRVRLVDRGRISARHGDVELRGSTARYTPEPDFFGSDALSFTVSDGTLETPARLELRITGVNDPPVVADRTFTVTEGAPVGTVIGVLDAADVDGDKLRFRATAGNTDLIDVTRNGAVVVAGEIDGDQFSGLQLRGYAEDPAGARDTFLVKVRVEGANEPPTLPDATFTVEAGAPPNTRVGRLLGTDPDGDRLVYEIVGQDANRILKVDATTGDVFVARRALPAFFPEVVTVRATDPGGLFDEAVLRVRAVDTRGPDLSRPLLDNPVVYEAAPGGGACSLGPNTARIGIKVTDPSGVAGVELRWSASFRDAPVSGVTPMQLTGDKASGSLTFEPGIVDDDGSSELVARVVATDEVGNTSTSSVIRITILRCTDDEIGGGPGG